MPKILSYIDMVKWIIDDTKISDKEFKTASQEVMGSFTLENLRLMYHLPEPQAIYNKKFVEKFTKEIEDLAECRKNWSTMRKYSKKIKMVCTPLVLFIPLTILPLLFVPFTTTNFHQNGYH